jgi:quinol monooxygenase YgiN
MAKLAIWVMLKAKPGKEADVEAFLKQGAVMSKDEPKTVNWYGVKIAPGMYGVFDTFDDEEGRDAHLSGEIAKALMANAPDLFANASELRIEKMDILADK